MNEINNDAVVETPRQKRDREWRERLDEKIRRGDRKRRIKWTIYGVIAFLALAYGAYYYLTIPPFAVNQPMEQNPEVSMRRVQETSPRALYHGENLIGFFQSIEDRGGFVLVSQNNKFGTYTVNPFGLAMEVKYNRPDELRGGLYFRFTEGGMDHIVDASNGRQVLKAFPRVKDVFDGLAIVTQDGQDMLVELSMEATPIIDAGTNPRASNIAQRPKAEITRLNSDPVTLSVKIGERFFLFSTAGALLNSNGNAGFFRLDVTENAVRGTTNQAGTTSRNINPATGRLL
jgi:hypothetical protein